MTRQYLLTKLVCSRCGTNLNLTYDVPKSAGRYVSGEPTGSDTVQQLIAVEPCCECDKPMQEIRRAIGVLKGVV